MQPSVQMITVDSDDQGQRIDNYLIRKVKGVPKTLIYRWLRKGEVRVNKKRVKPVYKLETGDMVRIPPVRQSDPGEPLKDVPASLRQRLLDGIVFEDDRYLVINKPSGLASHGGSGLSFGLIEALRLVRDDLKTIELAHRLDKETSGCILLTKKRSALRTFQQLQREHEITKQYLALTCGHWPLEKMTVTAKLETRKLNGGERVVKVSKEGKPSETTFEVLEKYGDYTLVKATLGTGRTHQIRVHSQYQNAPLAGDPKYGDKAANLDLKKKGLKRLFLHACYLGFTDPDTGKSYDFSSPLEPELTDLLDAL